MALLLGASDVKANPASMGAARGQIERSSLNFWSAL
jgi:hypothetical protein